jgi:hypothetical protein
MLPLVRQRQPPERTVRGRIRVRWALACAEPAR